MLYRGESFETENGIVYQNVEEYLKDIPEPIMRTEQNPVKGFELNM